MTRNMVLTILSLAALAFAASAPVSAQIRGSEHGVVAQTIDGTTLTVEYHRPSARGRELFGALMPWNVAWTPGANWATTLEVDNDIRVNGVEVPAGKYSVWSIPRPDRFTITFNPDPEIFHFFKPDSTSEQIHVSAEPEELPHVEMLTWSFPVVRGDAAVLQMQWGTTAVALQVVVPPSKPVVLTQEQRDAYIGTYALEIVPGIGWPTTGEMVVFEENGLLRARLPFGIHPGDELDFDLVPAGTDRFNPGLYHDGKLFNIEMGVNFDFVVDAGTAGSMKMLAANGMVLAEGERAR